MSQLLSRTPFLEDTASLFSSSKLIDARNKIVEFLNESTTASPTNKVEILLKIQEIILHSELELLEEFLENILAFAYDTNQDVRKTIAAFVEEVCKQKIQFLPRIITALVTLLRDKSAMVIKRVIQGCASIYKNALCWICSSADITDDLEHSWNTLCLIKAQILDMVDHDNDGIRTNAIKFLEGVILLQTYADEDSMKRENDFSLEDVPLTLKIVRRRKLEDEAINIFDLLLKFHGASHISSVNLIACTGTLCTIAKMRPTLMSPVVEALKNLHSNLPPTLTNSQVSSVRKNLKMQFLNIIKHPGSFELQASIVQILSELGASNSEITRAIPKIDKKEQQRRAKRALENSKNSSFAKKAKLELEEKQRLTHLKTREMEVDEDEILEQKRKSNIVNEQFVLEGLKHIDTVTHIVLASMPQLADDCPEHFLENYTPVVNLSLQQQMQKIAKSFAPQITEKLLGPGAKEISAEPPMRVKVQLDDDIGSKSKDFEEMSVDPQGDEDDEEALHKDETNKMRMKLRETLERVKGEQAAFPKLKQRMKQLKLHEITKTLSKETKTEFLHDAVRRILKCERQAIMGGVAFKRKRIVVIFASTFMSSVRDIILEYIYEDIVKRLDLAFLWLFEEYSLLQGFTRHSYVKTEHKHDYAYNLLLTEIITNLLERQDLREKESIIKRIYLEAPLITDEAFKLLVGMCETETLTECGMQLVKDLLIRRPPKEAKLLAILLQYSHNQSSALLREKALDNLVCVYSLHKIQTDKIEAYACKWLSYLEAETPSAEFLKALEWSKDQEVPKVWTEDLIKLCLNLFLTILGYNEGLIHTLCALYIGTSSDIKRKILHAIDPAIKKLGDESKELMNVIETCEKGTETLVTRIIYILTEKKTPTLALVEIVRHLYQTKVSDVRVLMPVINSLTRKEIIITLPKFLKLNPNIVKEVFVRLLGVGLDSRSAAMLPISPTELLVALHTLDSNSVELKFVLKATSLCLAEKEVYTQEVLVAVMQQLVEISPLPTLLMRTVIQSTSLYPRLAGFVTNLLHRLIVKQVWKQKLVWDGFLKCCQRLQPQSLGVLIQLPVPQLKDALNICPELRASLLEYAKEITEHQLGTVPSHVMDVLYDKVTPDVMFSGPEGEMNQPIRIKQEAEEGEHLPPVPGLD